jgi:DNA (cytosine-5)-methyltransferase 1
MDRTNDALSQTPELATQPASGVTKPAIFPALMVPKTGPRALTFVDLFAGCGGLSLGLMSAGLSGIFAVERDELAFSSLQSNLIDAHPSSKLSYSWPSWLGKKPAEITSFIEEHVHYLEGLAGQIDVIAGGPPCQGFSLAGRRKSNDPRNRLFKHYLRIVELLKPPYVLLENVRGVSIAFRKTISRAKNANLAEPFSERIGRELNELGYDVFTKLVHGTDVGVPQLRPRYILIGVRAELLDHKSDVDPFHNFDFRRKAFLRSKGLPTGRPVTVAEAISDLEVQRSKLVECVDSPGFQQISYRGPRTTYQRLLHGALDGAAPNSLRLARHRDETRKRFINILATCPKGVGLSDANRARLGLRKHCITPLHPKLPSHTLTTLPDDFLHYSEPRILTVREYARLQSFPDWYEFAGKYTTGGDRRLRECPRYTQVGNAVPPFLAEFLGRLLVDLDEQLCSSKGN